MNKELSRILNVIGLAGWAAILLSWARTIFEKSGITHVAGFDIWYAYPAIQSGLFAMAFCYLSLHARNRYKLGDTNFIFPAKVLASLTLVALWETAEALCQIGEEISYLKIGFEIVLITFVMHGLKKLLNKNGNI